MLYTPGIKTPISLLHDYSKDSKDLNGKGVEQPVMRNQNQVNTGQTNRHVDRRTGRGTLTQNKQNKRTDRHANNTHEDRHYNVINTTPRENRNPKPRNRSSFCGSLAEV